MYKNKCTYYLVFLFASHVARVMKSKFECGPPVPKCFVDPCLIASVIENVPRRLHPASSKFVTVTSEKVHKLI